MPPLAPCALAAGCAVAPRPHRQPVRPLHPDTLPRATQPHSQNTQPNPKYLPNPNTHKILNQTHRVRLR
eukprot:6840216-Prymnesium_polylepis.1